jgi:predicted TPR repeat methyltransferase
MRAAAACETRFSPAPARAKQGVAADERFLGRKGGLHYRMEKPVNDPQALESARQLHRAGRLAEAEAIYRGRLAMEPDDADALHLLGIVAGQTGRQAEAADLLRRAIALRPDDAEMRKNLGVTLKAAGRPDEAVAAFRQAVALKPDYAEAHKNLGSALHQMGRLEEAIAAYREAVAMQPGFAEARNNLGVALRDAGRLEEAEAACRGAIALRPDHAAAHNNLGNALHDQGRFGDAIGCYRAALQLKPDFTAAWNNLGIALKANGEADAAIDAFGNALALQPDYAEAWLNLGDALRDAARNAEAVAAFRKAVELKPDFADAFGCLGNALKSEGRNEEAIAAYRRAVELAPDSADWRHVLAALTGERSARTTPPGYVRKLFDHYAREFDEHLVGKLGYRVPELMREAVASVAPDRRFDILDLGCGTGLCGAQFHDIAGELAGVDLSPWMISKAAARGIYTRLVTGDIAEAMRENEEAFDLILAGDSFIYVGDLGEVFAAAARTLRGGGLFAFSLERHEGEGFVLHAKVRFAHSIGYIRALARAHAFEELHVREITVRKSGRDDVGGWLVVLGKPGAPSTGG